MLPAIIENGVHKRVALLVLDSGDADAIRRTGKRAVDPEVAPAAAVA